jgi:hypothetical protein
MLSSRGTRGSAAKDRGEGRWARAAETGVASGFGVFLCWDGAFGSSGTVGAGMGKGQSDRSGTPCLSTEINNSGRSQVHE